MKSRNTTWSPLRAASFGFARSSILLVVLSLSLLPLVVGQYLTSDPRYTLMKAQNQDAQQEMLKANPELVMDYTPGIKVRTHSSNIASTALARESQFANSHGLFVSSDFESAAAVREY